jgi:bifunctional ADP-heptose synthase (sugar kinase/adenylyltransferase)
MVLYTKDGLLEFVPTFAKEVFDVSGAGDTVISVATLCLAQGLKPDLTTALANLAGGLVCEEVGVKPVNKERLIEEITNSNIL